MDFELPEEHQMAYESALAFARSEIGAGTNEIRQLLIARELLGMR